MGADGTRWRSITKYFLTVLLIALVIFGRGLALGAIDMKDDFPTKFRFALKDSVDLNRNRKRSNHRILVLRQYHNWYIHIPKFNNYQAFVLVCCARILGR